MASKAKKLKVPKDVLEIGTIFFGSGARGQIRYVAITGVGKGDVVAVHEIESYVVRQVAKYARETVPHCDKVLGGPYKAKLSVVSSDGGKTGDVELTIGSGRTAFHAFLWDGNSVIEYMGD